MNLGAFVWCSGKICGAIGKFVGGHLSDFVGERKVMASGFFLVTGAVISNIASHGKIEKLLYTL